MAIVKTYLRFTIKTWHILWFQSCPQSFDDNVTYHSIIVQHSELVVRRQKSNIPAFDDFVEKNDR